ncbi:MAG: hypothetical protein MJZ61_01905 [Bacteroidales bacterium]|nr:hypothetical protein [Bacteroidales bacterium]
MKRFFAILCAVLDVWLAAMLCQPCYAADTLRRDSLMLTTGVEVVFKAGTHYRTDKRGLVVEGTPAQEVDLWTPGPMILFSSSGPIRLNAEGRVVAGVLGANALINCADNVFREFARENRVVFNDEGLLMRGTLVGAIPFVVNGQEFLSQPYKPIGFYPSGKIHLVHPQGNFRFSTADGTRVVISGSSWIEISEKGTFLRGALLRKLSFRNQSGEVVHLNPGDIIRMDEDGNIISY